MFRKGVCLPLAFQAHDSGSEWFRGAGMLMGLPALQAVCVACVSKMLLIAVRVPCTCRWGPGVGAGICLWVLDLHLRFMEVSALTPAWALADRPAGMRVGWVGSCIA